MKTPLKNSQCNGSLNRRRLAFIALGLASVASLAGCKTGLSMLSPNTIDFDEQRETVETFYRTVIDLQVFGLPTRSQLQALTPLMSDRLLGLLRDAQAAQARALARHRGAEPPLVQGALWVSLFEGATRLVQVQRIAGLNAWQATLAYQQGSNAVEWQDRVWLVNQARAGTNRWFVDDIEFGGQWDFARQGRLSTMLGNVIDQPGP